MTAAGTVKKGEKWQIVVFWTWLEKENEQTGEKGEIPFLRYYTVFEISKQCEGLPSKRNDQTFVHDPIEEAERICKGYQEAPLVCYASGRAFYRPSDDCVIAPPLRDYGKPEEYYSTYSTLFHEHVHSTGHTKRLNRSGITEIAAFGDEATAKKN